MEIKEKIDGDDMEQGVESGLGNRMGVVVFGVWYMEDTFFHRGAVVKSSTVCTM